MISWGTAFDGSSGACFDGFLGAGADASSTLAATATAGRGCILAGVDGRVSWWQTRGSNVISNEPNAAVMLLLWIVDVDDAAEQYCIYFK
mgnify:CR=1 FL=1